jgi:superfamily II DNA/RNA helicase
MIFTRTKRTAQKVADDLGERGFKVGAVHGDLNQVAREKALKSFRTGDIDVLVATDVAARGIDIDDVTHVINYQCPDDEKTYVHRIGRTGRAGKTGVAVTLVDWDELARWTLIDKALNLCCPDPSETYSSSPHLYTELNIPTEAGGTIGKPTRAPAKRTEGGDRELRETSGDRQRAPRNANRSRRRTRGGQAGSADASPPAVRPGDAGEVRSAAASEDTGQSASRRRRRRRPSKAAAAVNGS